MCSAFPGALCLQWAAFTSDRLPRIDTRNAFAEMVEMKCLEELISTTDRPPQLLHFCWDPCARLNATAIHRNSPPWVKERWRHCWKCVQVFNPYQATAATELDRINTYDSGPISVLRKLKPIFKQAKAVIRQILEKIKGEMSPINTLIHCFQSTTVHSWPGKGMNPEGE